jgi:hypothetical protein
MRLTKDSRALVAWAKRRGFSVRVTDRQHLRFTHPLINRVLTTSARPHDGDHRPMQILRTALHRASQETRS